MTGAASFNGSASMSASSTGSVVQPPVLKSAEDGDKDELSSTQLPVLTSLFGVLYTVYKDGGNENVVYHWFIIKSVLIYWQLFPIVFSPSMGWAIKGDGRLWWWLGLPTFGFLRDMDHSVYVALMYSLISLVALNHILVQYIAYGFRRRKFDYVWPIKVERYVVLLWDVCDVTCLNLFQIAFKCQISGPSNGPRGSMAFFPERMCKDMPNLIHAIVAGTMSVIFVSQAVMLNMQGVDVNIYSRSPDSMGNSTPEVRGLLLKVFLGTFPAFIGHRRVVAVIYVLVMTVMVWNYLRWSPYLTGWVNHVRVGVFTSLFYVTFILVFLVFNPGMKDHEYERVKNFQRAMTYLMAAGLLPAGLLGVLLSWLRLKHFHEKVLAAFTNATADARPRMVFKFLYPEDVEIAARLGRIWDTEEDLNKNAVSLAGNIIKVGLAYFPTSPLVLMLQANYLMDGPVQIQAAHRQAQAASKQDPSITVRFMIFVREQMATRQVAGGSGALTGGEMDLVGYVEYQRKHTLVIRAHKEALLATSQFWQLLHTHNVSFKALSMALSNIDETIKKAEQSYRVALNDYGNSAKLLRLYAKFLETVKNDPAAAARFHAEASKLDELHGDGHVGAEDEGLTAAFGEAAALNGGALPEGIAQAETSGSMTVVANAAGMIQLTNKATSTTLGYRRGELEGKNLKGLMPPPWSGKHVTYLKNYIKRGDDQVSLPTCHVVVLHRLGYGFPVTLSVVRTSGLGEDTVFMGVLKPLKSPPGVCRLWVLPNGSVACADSEFCATFGYHPGELAGTRLSRYLQKQFPGTRQSAVGRRRADMLRSLGLPERHDGAAIVEDQRKIDKYVDWFLSRKCVKLPASVAVAQSVFMGYSGASVTFTKPTVALLSPPGRGSFRSERSAAQDPTRKLEPASPLHSHRSDGGRRQDEAVGHARPAVRKFSGPSDLTATWSDADADADDGGRPDARDSGFPDFAEDDWQAFYTEDMTFKHKYSGPVPCKVRAREIGTQNAVLVELEIEPRFPNGYQFLMISDAKGSLRYVSSDMGFLLGLTEVLPTFMARFGYRDQNGHAHEYEGLTSDAIDNSVELKLSDFMPLPWSAMHMGWLKDASESTSVSTVNPLRSCRGGAAPAESAVLTMCDLKGNPMPMRISVKSNDDLGEKLHFIEANWCTYADGVASHRVQVTLSETGMVQSVADGTPEALFGFDPKELLGLPLWSFMDFGTDETSVNVHNSDSKKTHRLPRNASHKEEEGGTLNDWAAAAAHGMPSAAHGKPLGPNAVHPVTVSPSTSPAILPGCIPGGRAMVINAPATNAGNAQTVEATWEVEAYTDANENARLARAASFTLPWSVNGPQQPGQRMAGPGNGSFSAHRDRRVARAAALYSAMLKKAMVSPGCSWQMTLIPPNVLANIYATMQDPSLVAGLLAKKARAAILQLDVVAGPGRVSNLSITANIWLTQMVSGVLEVDLKRGSVSKVLEQELRPGHLFFAMGGARLVGTTLSSLLDSSLPGQTPTANQERKEKKLASFQLLKILADGSLEPKAKGALKSGTYKQSQQVGPTTILKAANREGQRPIYVSVQLTTINTHTAILCVRPAEPIALPKPQALFDILLGKKVAAHAAPVHQSLPVGRMNSTSLHMRREPTDLSRAHSSFGGLTNPSRPSIAAAGTAEVRSARPAANVGFVRLDPSSKATAEEERHGVDGDLADSPGMWPSEGPMALGGRGAQTSANLVAGDFTLGGVSALNDGSDDGEGTRGHPRDSSRGVGNDAGDGAPGRAALRKPGSLEGSEGGQNPHDAPLYGLRCPAGVAGFILGAGGCSSQKAAAEEAVPKEWAPHTPDASRGPIDQQDKREASEVVPFNNDVTCTQPVRPTRAYYEDDDGDGEAGDDHEKGRADGNDEGDHLSDDDQGQRVKNPQVSSWVKSEGAYFQTDKARDPKPSRTPRSGGVSAPIADPPRALRLDPRSPPGEGAQQLVPHAPSPSVLRGAVFRAGQYLTMDTRDDGQRARSDPPLSPSRNNNPYNSGGAPQEKTEGKFIEWQLEDDEFQDNPSSSRPQSVTEEDDEGDLAPPLNSGASVGSAGEGASDAGDSAVSSGSTYHSSRRFKRLQRLMNSPAALKVLHRFRLHTLITLFVTMAVHIITFSVMTGTMQKHSKSIAALSGYVRTSRAGLTTMLAVSVLRNIQEGRWRSGIYNDTSVDEYLTMLDVMTNLLNTQLLKVIKAAEESGGAVKHLLHFETTQVWAATNADGSEAYRSDSLMNIATRVVSNARTILQMYRTWTAANIRLADQSEYKYVAFNVYDNFVPSFRKLVDTLFYESVPQTNSINNLHLAFLGVEGCCVALLASFYISVLVSRVAEQRYRVYKVFTTIPIGLTRALATRTLHLLDEDQDSSEEEEEEEIPFEGEGAVYGAQRLKVHAEGGDALVGVSALKKRPGVGFDAPASFTGPKNQRRNSVVERAGGRGHRKLPSRKSSSGLLRNTSVGLDPESKGRHSSKVAMKDETKDETKEGLLADGEASRGSPSKEYSASERSVWSSLKKRVSRLRSQLSGMPFFRSPSVQPTSGAPVASFGTHAPAFLSTLGSDKPRALKRDSRSTLAMIWPLWLWSALIIIVYTVGYTLLRDSVVPLANQAIVNYMPARVTLTAVAFHELCSETNVSNVPQRAAAALSSYRYLLNTYTYLLYGGEATLVIPASEMVVNYPLVSTSILRDSNAMYYYVFETRECQRFNASSCPGIWWPYYEITRMGVGPMMSTYLDVLEKSVMVAQQRPDYVNLSMPVLDFIFEVAMNDLLDGTMRLSVDHEKAMLDPFTIVVDLHIAVLVVGFLGTAAFMFFRISPHLRRIKKEKQQIAELLSQLPKEIDVSSAMTAAMSVGDETLAAQQDAPPPTSQSHSVRTLEGWTPPRPV